MNKIERAMSSYPKIEKELHRALHDVKIESEGGGFKATICGPHLDLTWYTWGDINPTIEQALDSLESKL